MTLKHSEKCTKQQKMVAVSIKSMVNNHISHEKVLQVTVIFFPKHIWKLKLETNSKIKNIRDL
jgi:hypothetical protein